MSLAVDRGMLLSDRRQAQRAADSAALAAATDLFTKWNKNNGVGWPSLQLHRSMAQFLQDVHKTFAGLATGGGLPQAKAVGSFHRGRAVERLAVLEWALERRPRQPRERRDADESNG
jgi:hypothetical protein